MPHDEWLTADGRGPLVPTLRREERTAESGPLRAHGWPHAAEAPAGGPANMIGASSSTMKWDPRGEGHDLPAVGGRGAGSRGVPGPCSGLVVNPWHPGPGAVRRRSRESGPRLRQLRSQVRLTTRQRVVGMAERL